METAKINCLSCKHFYVTWDPQFPRGCKAYGFKTKHLPSAEVLSSTGKPCLSYEDKRAKRP
ncbi:uracil-DNA glycosylase [Paenibacillus athensensis]|uniref:Uracil-DNA glycosylase n=1 Tax=Paenibacillus athensensis TaxID=1967502 RepID=A0A4Y8PSR9_9BACL|nr:uracil-DNA glycosylase [Paenibacillus athensensis]MCD1258333.1 uracil-DNA glycosylase [Paenibacillus athensensis]